MTHREIRVMILLESFVLGAVSIAVGIVNGYVLSYILIYVINKQSFGWTIAFHTPVALICASVATTPSWPLTAGRKREPCAPHAGEAATALAAWTGRASRSGRAEQVESGPALL